MSRSRSARRSTAGVLALAFALAVPAGAGAAPLRWLDFTDVWTGIWEGAWAGTWETAWHRLAGFREEAATGEAPDGKGSVWDEYGVGLDPNGNSNPTPGGSTPGINPR